MKKFIALLMCCLTFAMIACGEDPKGDETSDFKFMEPITSQISGTSTTVSCQVSAGAELLKLLPTGFLYGAESDDIEDYNSTADVVVDGATITARLKGLSPETAYVVMAYIELGTSRLTSPMAKFTTQTISSDETLLELTSKSNVVVPFTESNGVITYQVTNPVAGAKATAECAANWIHSFDNSVDGNITFIIDRNSGDERLASISVNYPEAESRQVTIRQEANTDAPGPEGKIVELTDVSGFPKTYPTSTKQFKLGDHNYFLTNVADYNNGIQFKSGSGKLSNGDLMGAIQKIEIVYTAKAGSKAIALCIGGEPQPEGNRIEPTQINGTYTFDLSSQLPNYFTLINGDGASYLSSIKIYTVDGGGTPEPPTPGAPAFGPLSVSGVTKNSASVAGSFTYSGSGVISDVCFIYRATTGTDQKFALTNDAGVKSALLTTLSEGTLYSLRLSVNIDGESHTSPSITFVTPSSSGGGQDQAKKSGWAELPAEKVLTNDYYYAYHMREDAKNIRNYAVCYSKKFECPMWVAAPMHNSYQGNSGRSDAYKQDPVLMAMGCSQVQKREGYTRGHMLGSSDRTISVATNRQVFYNSNIGPQLQNGFNQGGGVWNNLEEYTDKQFCADTLYQVIGCYWANTNKVSSGTTIPTHYYKLLLRTKKGNSGKWVANCTADELMCAAFLVEHNSSQKGVKPNRGMLKSVAELEQMTGFTFFTNVPNAPKQELNPAEWGL